MTLALALAELITRAVLLGVLIIGPVFAAALIHDIHHTTRKDHQE